MPNLVGIGNSQAPTNAMLGGLAYQDSVGEIDIEKIKAKTGDTAADIFVYDTRNDSDGGAWRKRTQNTSWYNEGESATRGARKEFPAVAVIVAEDDYTTIYDADDPNLSMWMTFLTTDTGGDQIFNRPQYWDSSAVFALNGILCIGNINGSAEILLAVNYVSDSAIMYPMAGYPTYGGRYTLPISDRSNSSGTFEAISTNIVGDELHDVAMTVLPNAPIDVATGLPIPTIATAHGHGVSVIKDDATIVDITSGTIIHHEPRNIAFLGTRLLWTEGNNYDLQDRAFLNASVPTADTVLPHGGALPSGYIGYGIGSGAATVFNNFSLLLPLNNELSSPARERKFCIDGPDDTIVLGCKHAVNGGLELLHQDASTPANGMVATVTTSYNTGWMHGDCKLAVVCDTDTTNISSSNLMSGATYNTSARVDSYSYSNGSSTLVINDQQSSADGYVNLTLGGLTASTTYVMTATANQSYTPTSGYWHHIGNTTDGTIYFEDNFVGTTTTQKVTFKTASSGNPTIVLYSGYNGALTYTMDLRLAEFDRSSGYNSSYNAAQNSKIGQKDGLGIYGTITKTAVATGADLVSYSGFEVPESGVSLSVTNALIQPYNHSLSGTQFVFSGWFKTSTNADYQYVVQISDTLTNQTIGGLAVFVTGGSNAGLPYMWSATGSSGGESGIFDGSRVDDNRWHHFVAIFDNTNKTLYIDGVSRGSSSISGTITSSFTGAEVYMGMHRQVKSSGDNKYRHYFRGDIALVRISKSVPSAEQVKKMYNDEKQLFLENAKCTLYGSSDAVTAIAYDDSNDIVHVGTSSGRSEFVGLNRINNTTTAVTTAISASNGVVAEQ